MRGEEIVTEQASRWDGERRNGFAKIFAQPVAEEGHAMLARLRVKERSAMNKRMGRASFLKLLLVFFVAAHPLPAQEANKAIHIAVDLRKPDVLGEIAKMKAPPVPAAK